ncbi:hypothetical protein V6N12_042407 [Hibiscus sabdariffa]|uniref:CASP-like protein n=1 Tax=Hibiscus sabdariffa TaxID=183260 RepID=A0ABR2EF45_9ROSI
MKKDVPSNLREEKGPKENIVFPMKKEASSHHRTVLKMAVVGDGLRLFVKTFWGMQERRFSATFDVVTSAAISITMAFVVCLFSIHRHARSEIGPAAAFI